MRTWAGVSWRRPLLVAPRRILLRLLDGVLNRRSVVGAVGWLNRRWPLVGSVFVAYPASWQYADHFFTVSTQEFHRRTPLLCGVLLQNRRLVVAFGITASEAMIRSGAHVDDLRADLEQALG